MHVKKLKAIYEVLKNTYVHSLELSGENERIRIKRRNAHPEQEALPNKKNNEAANSNLAEEAITKDDAANKKPAADPLAENVVSFDVCSSEIGEFSRFNPKNKHQYVKLRDVIEQGSIVGVITSMHIANEVRAEQKGKIVEFLVEENQPVEFGQPLLRCIAVNEK